MHQLANHENTCFHKVKMTIRRNTNYTISIWIFL